MEISIMTYPTYTQQALSGYTLPRLKRTAAQLGVTPTGNKTQRQTWVNAIITHQSTQLQKVDEQATAQAELDNFIATQAQTVAPETLTPVEISFYDHEYYAGDKLIAAITHDDNDFVTQRWVVMVNGAEEHRADTWAKCYRYIQWHYQDGTLPVQEQLSEANDTSGNEIMVQVFNECEKYGFDIFDDGIYQNDVKLGEVGCTDGCWWVMRSGESQQQPCNSAMDAVWWLSMVDVLPHTEAADCEELLDRPFEMLTAQDWELLREYEPRMESRELVAA
jgi:hypothetical protein